ncbi:hypothetical protein [uncultured Sulfitobacter sp.]|uniref:hypothetical protein n=1 Tax=uncultured Sulfitobacter sp. TaxID=191468 RepID=UPI00262A01BD|nr:hypothetical protein [uncultured Sulfitobacter sp.]
MNITFPSEDIAVSTLRAVGFSVGCAHRNEPRGLIVGAVEIAKWKTLSCKERKECHGTYQIDVHTGRVTVALRDHCPDAAVKALLLHRRKLESEDGNERDTDPDGAPT